MKKCKECQSSVADDAFRCPACGHQLRTHGCTGCFALPVIVALILYLVILWGTL